MSAPLNTMRTIEMSTGNPPPCLGTEVMDVKCKMCRFAMSPEYLKRSREEEKGKEMNEEDARKECDARFCQDMKGDKEEKFKCAEACLDMVRPGDNEMRQALCDTKLRRVAKETMAHFVAKGAHPAGKRFLECAKFDGGVSLKMSKIPFIKKDLKLAWKGVTRKFADLAEEYMAALKYVGEDCSLTSTNWIRRG